MLGTIVNCLAIIAGSMVGLLFKNGIPDRYNQTVMQAVGLAVLLVGLKTAFVSDDLLVIIISLAMGALLGEGVGIEDRLALENFWKENFQKDPAGSPRGLSRHP
jgi:hypothetical protein